MGHVISQDGVSTSPEKVEAVKNWPVPKTRKHVRSFLGLMSYYRKYIANFSTLAKPLTYLTSIFVPFTWTPECQNAFDSLKQRLITEPILGHPFEGGIFILDTDASDVGIGGVLSQVQNDREVVICYASHTIALLAKNSWLLFTMWQFSVVI